MSTAKQLDDVFGSYSRLKPESIDKQLNAKPLPSSWTSCLLTYVAWWLLYPRSIEAQQLPEPLTIQAALKPWSHKVK